MRYLTQALAVLAVAALSILATGCNKGPAETALKASEQALEAARPELARYTPDELESLTTAIADARRQFEKGNYTEALKAAQGLPARIDAAVSSAAAKRDELAKAWAGISDAVQPAVDSLTTKVAALAAMRKPPRGMDAARLGSAQADLGALTTAWAEAGEAFRSGDVPRAVRIAQDVRAKVTALSDLLGLAPPAPPAALASK
jgi:hypothetical protein